MDTATLKIVFGWGMLKASDLETYVPGQISEVDFKDITGEEFKNEG